MALGLECDSPILEAIYWNGPDRRPFTHERATHFRSWIECHVCVIFKHDVPCDCHCIITEAMSEALESPESMSMRAFKAIRSNPINVK
jgi:hypothetical protein